MTAAAYAADPLPIGGPVVASRRFDDVLAGIILLCAFVGLSLFTNVSPYLATVIIGTGGLIATAAALHFKYRGRLAFDCEIGFILASVIQFLFAPLVIRLITNDFDFGAAHQSGERYAVKDFYGQAMLIVLLFFAAYFFASALFPVKRPGRSVEGRLEVVYSQRTLVVMAALTAMLWMTRAALLATGSFYHLHRSSFQKDDPRYSGWVQFDGGIGPMVVSFLWGALFVKRLPAWLVIGYTLVDFGWGFASGSRERPILTLLAIALTFIIYRNRIPWRTMMIMALPIALLVGFMDYYRYALQRTTDVNVLSVSGITSAMSIASRESSSGGFRDTAIRGVMRFSDLEPIAAIYAWTGSTQPFLRGETYGRIPAGLIPRAFWPDKPMVITPINEWYFVHEGGSSPITVMGEGYMNFGWPGVVLAGVIAAVMVRAIDWFVIRYLWNVAILPVYIGTVATISRVHTQAIAVWIPTALKIMFLTFMVHLLTRPQRYAESDLLPGVAEHPAAPTPSY